MECRPSVLVTRSLLPRHSTRAAGLDQDGRRVTDLLHRQGTPGFLARVLVEGDDGAALAADQAEDLATGHQQVRRPAPDGRLDLEVLREVVRPEDLPAGGVQA